MKKQKRITLYVPEDEYRELKSQLALLGKTVSGWFREAIRKFLSKEERPKCLGCGKRLEPWFDKKRNKIDPYSWTCECTPGVIISIG